LDFAGALFAAGDDGGFGFVGGEFFIGVAGFGDLVDVEVDVDVDFDGILGGEIDIRERAAGESGAEAEEEGAGDATHECISVKERWRMIHGFFWLDDGSRAVGSRGL
jgi:hypothetical protein